MQREDKHREEETVENMDDLTDKIILAVLDHLDSAGPVRTDRMTKGLLISTVEKLQKIFATTDVGKSGEKNKAQLLPDEIRRSAARTVRQILLRSTEAWEMISSSSSFPNSLVGEIGLDSMLEAMARSGYPTDLLRSLLDSTSRDILQTIECNENVSSYRNFILDRMTKRTNEKVKTFLTVSAELVRNGGTEFQQDTEPCSSSRPSHMDDLTIKCTHDVIDGIIQVCHQHGRGGSAELSEQGVEEVMQELESIISSRGSSSRQDLKVIDLEESEETSLLSEGFHQKVKCAVSDALLQTTGEVSSQFNTTLGDITVEDLEMCAEQSATSLQSSALVESAASDIAEAVVEDLKKVSSQQVHNGSVTEPEPPRENSRSAAYRLYRNVHSMVFGFLSRLQESHSSSVSESRAPISPPPRCIPRTQVQEGSCMDELFVKVVELYKSEPLLPSSAYRRAFSSAAQTTSAADVHPAADTTPVFEAVERNLESSNSSWETLNSSCETLSRLGDVSRPPAGPHTSNPFTVFRRVKDFFSSSSSQVEDNVPVDPDPATVKKRGLGFRKRLARTFSAIRRALPNPFQCVTGQP